MTRGRPSGLVTAVCLGVGARIVALASGSGVSRFRFADSEAYLALARGMPRILWTGDQSLVWDSVLRPPVYPVVIRVMSFGAEPNVWSVVVFQCVLGGVVNVWLVHRVARSWAGPLAAGVAAVVMALDPVSLSHNLLIASETVYVTALLGAALCLTLAFSPSEVVRSRPPLMAAAGIALGLACLTRPILVYFPVVLAGLFWVRRPRRWRHGMTLLAPMVLLAGGWLARNAVVAGEPSFTSVQSLNAYFLGAAARAVDHGELRLGFATGPSWDESIGRANAALAAEYARRHPGDADAPELDPGRVGREAMLEHPVGVVRAASVGAARTLVGPSGRLLAHQMGLRAPLADALFVATGVVLFGEYMFAIVGLAALVRRRTLWILLGLAVPAAYHLVLSASPLSYARYRIPLVPALAIAAGIGAASVVGAARARRGSPPLDQAP